MNIEKLYVNKIGKGYPIIMLHGFPLDHNSLMPFESYFDENSKWQRYYIDLPGMGQSRGAGAKRTLPKRAVYYMSNLDSRIDQEELLAYRATVVLESQDNFNLFKKYILPGLNSNEGNEIVRYLSENPKLAKEPSEYLKSYKGSVTIVAGQNDNMVGFQDAFSLYCTLQEAEFVCISKAGHTLHLDRPAIIKEIFTEWLRNLNARVTS